MVKGEIPCGGKIEPTLCFREENPPGNRAEIKDDNFRLKRAFSLIVPGFYGNRHFVEQGKNKEPHGRNPG